MSIGATIKTWTRPRFESSAAVITPFFATLAEARAAGAAMSQLRGIGMAAEREMLRVTGGINTSAGARSGRIVRSRIGRSTRPPDRSTTQVSERFERWSPIARRFQPTARAGMMLTDRPTSVD